MSHPKPQSLPRHTALQPLSRDHYMGLVHGQHLMKAADGSAVDRQKALRAFLDAWAIELVVHFDDEERLLPQLLDAALNKRLSEEHVHLRALAAEARLRHRQIDPGADWIRTLGKTLTDHIRWEERELFTFIQANANAAQLEALAAQTEIVEQSRARAKARGRQ